MFRRSLTTMRTPTAFVSYSWDSEDHKAWVRDLAAKLRNDGVDVRLDRWELKPGDQLPSFMETSVRENDFVLIVCTPNYKAKSDHREGGVGYEWDIMTGEAFSGKDPRKFIPVLRAGTWQESSPSWLLGKYGVDLRRDPCSADQYKDLLNTLHGTREQAPLIGVRPLENSARPAHDTSQKFLSPETAAILLEAATGDGLIIAFESDEGLAVIAGDRRFDEPGNPRSDSRLRDTLRRLIASGYAEQDSESSLRITKQGFAYADSLEPRKAASGSSPSFGSGPIKITGIIANQVGTPRNDGTQGSALYAVPFQLSRRPSPEWAESFVQTWERPPSSATRHRPRIARVEGNRIILDRTTVDEVADVHRDTLVAVVEKVNRDIEDWERQRRRSEEEEAERRRQHKQSVEEAAERIRFD